MTVKDHEKFTIVSHCDLEIISVAFMNYQKSSLYAQYMMNMIFRSHKFFAHCYIDDIVIFLKILKNHLKHLNTVFSLFDKMKITFKEVKTHLDYSSIILLDQQVDDFGMTSSKKQIAALQDLSFLKTLKDLKIYLDLTGWLQQYISYYAQQIKLLQDRKTALLCEDSTAGQTRKDYLKKTSIFNVSELEKETFEFIQKIFDDFNFLHHQNLN